MLLADYAKGLFGVDGDGVTVGVISDSATRVGGGLADSVATGNLPPGIAVVRLPVRSTARTKAAR